MLIAGISCALIPMLYIYFKQGSHLFIPAPRSDWPETAKKLFSKLVTEKSKDYKYLGKATPWYHLKPLIEEVLENYKNATIKCVSYNFNYHGYGEGCDWFKFLKEFVEKGGELKLVGGFPPASELIKNIRKLIEKGAEIRFLDKPPTTHVLICYQNSEPKLIWFEGYHKDDEATGVVYAKFPRFEHSKLAEEYFNELWSIAKTQFELSE